MEGAGVSEPATRQVARRRTHQLRRLLAGACLAVALTATATGATGQAHAAEAGVVLTNPQTQTATESALGTHWVRLFATWPDLEPQRGVYLTGLAVLLRPGLQSAPARVRK